MKRIPGVPVDDSDNTSRTDFKDLDFGLGGNGLAYVLQPKPGLGLRKVFPSMLDRLNAEAAATSADQAPIKDTGVEFEERDTGTSRALESFPSGKNLPPKALLSDAELALLKASDRFALQEYDGTTQGIFPGGVTIPGQTSPHNQYTPETPYDEQQ